MKSCARTLAIAVALGIVGFFAAVGLMSVLFASKTDGFAPKNSADAAGWVQAIGSIVAIVGAFIVGARQAKAAHQSAFALEEMRRQHRERGADSIQRRLISTCDDAITCITSSGSVGSFTSKWKDEVGPAFRVAIHAFDSVPWFEVCHPDRIDLALRIRELSGEVADLGERGCGPQPPEPFDQTGWLRMKSVHRSYLSRLNSLKAELARALT